MTIQQLHIFLSSPGDVSRERQLALELIDQIQSERAYRDRLKLQTVAWDKRGAGTAMSAHMEPQEAIDKGLRKPGNCDICIVIFRTRMGTPLSEKYLKPDGSRYRSGTEYEYLDALRTAEQFNRPDVFVYRMKEPPPPGLRDPERKEKERQWELVEEFFAEFRNPDGSCRGSFKEYDEPSDFKELLADDLRDTITKYLEAHPPEEAEAPAITQEDWWEDSPFPGLRAFKPNEAIIYHGRGWEVDDLISRLTNRDCRFLAVVGASGSGKSSLVAAGLLPALEKNAIHGSGDWVWRRFTPGEAGDNPFMALSIAFKEMLEKDGLRPRDLAVELEKDVGSFNNFLAKVLEGKPDWAELMVFIDQFEELFTLVDKKYVNTFAEFVNRASKMPRIRMVVTMRADFFHRCLEWPVLDELLKEGQYTLLAPKNGAMREMITRPAERARARFEEGLVRRIVDDIGTGSGALALMAYALSELWEATKGVNRVLTYSAYNGFGGVQGAIAKRAEDIFKRTLEDLKTNEGDLQQVLSRILSELIDVDDRGVVTRRRAKLSQFADGAMAEVLVNSLTEARLLVASSSEGNEAMREVAHEAVFTHWPRLRELIEVGQNDYRLLRQMRFAAAEWEKEMRNKHFLWPQERLVPVIQVIERMRPVLSHTELEFLHGESNQLLREINDKETTHQRRANIGDRLAEMGDPRPGVGLRKDGLPDIVWCKVPERKIVRVEKIVSQERPEGKTDLRKELETLHIAPFYIGKYPVTWIQYRSFLEAKDGYRDQGWWKWAEVRQDRPGEQYRKLDNHPAESVSWCDAVAFCRWLTAKLGYEVLLPTSFQWTHAARGGNPGANYPWGSTKDSSKANTKQSGLGRTTAVGMYPQGASQGIGALDMSGNVWEWCLHDSAETEASREGVRVLCGGSWYDDLDDACCNSCIYGHASSRLNVIGFRLACASPPPIS